MQLERCHWCIIVSTGSPPVAMATATTSNSGNGHRGTGREQGKGPRCRNGDRRNGDPAMAGPSGRSRRRLSRATKKKIPRTAKVQMSDPTCEIVGPNGFHIKTCAILLTYNYQDFPTYESFYEAAKEKLHDDDLWAIVHERETRDHGHMYVYRPNRQIDCMSSHYAVLGSLPNVQCNTVKGSGAKTAAQRGHFYCACKFKDSYIQGSVNWIPGKDYVVKSQWIMNMYKMGKLSDPIAACAHYRCLTPAIQAEVTMTEAYRRRALAVEAKRKREEDLLADLAPFLPCPIFDSFMEQYATAKLRYKFLVITGPSLQGKTTFIKTRFNNIFWHTDAINWGNYDEDKHDCVAFDDVSTIYDYVTSHKSLFQASGSTSVNTSKTNCYALQIDTTAKPLVILHNYDPYDEWITANSFHINVAENPLISK